MSPDFNSIKVRLELNHSFYSLYEKVFQFHKGTIRTQGNDPTLLGIDYFNSIKVRLEKDEMASKNAFTKFQ